MVDFDSGSDLFTHSYYREQVDEIGLGLTTHSLELFFLSLISHFSSSRASLIVIHHTTSYYALI